MSLILRYFSTAVSAVPLTFLLTGAGVDPLTNLLTAAGAVPLKFLLLVAGVVLLGLTVDDFAQGRGGVNALLMREEWLKADERCSNGGSKAAKRGRSVSISYETLRTGDDFSGEGFQNTGTFIVVRSSVFAVSSAQKTHLARDAYHAYSRRAGRRQGPFIQYWKGAGGKCLVCLEKWVDFLLQR